jgi:succinyl-diaminopimelate desuccinylase
LLDLVIHEFDGCGFTIEHFFKNDVKSVLVYKENSRPEKFRILLTMHLDVIAETDAERYKMSVDGDKIYGCGSLDMKGGAAVGISVFKKIARELPYSIALQIVTDEEVGGHDGAKHQIEQGVKADFVLATEPTNFGIVDSAKGKLQGRILTRGKTAHGAYPWRGDNALMRLYGIIAKLQAGFPDATETDNWHSTINVAKISTLNEVINAIPDDAEALIDIRFIPEDKDTLLPLVKSAMDEQSEFIVDLFDGAMSNKKNNTDIELLKSTTTKRRRAEEQYTGETILYGANGYSDAAHFTAAGSAGVEFGPVGGGIHAASGEWVSKKSLYVYEKILEEFLKNI